jgi:acyl-coenzyme A synthetase/AMP-(fatty) acid ligase
MTGKGETGRQILAAAIVLNGEGKAKFEGKERGEISAFFKEALGRYFEPVIIPRRWRYPDSLPQDAQGKRSRKAVEALFTEDNA